MLILSAEGNSINPLRLYFFEDILMTFKIICKMAEIKAVKSGGKEDVAGVKLSKRMQC